jgi:hypothetical protein
MLEEAGLFLGRDGVAAGATGAGFLAMETLAFAADFADAAGRAAGRARPDETGAGAFRETFLGGALAAAFFDIGQPSFWF